MKKAVVVFTKVPKAGEVKTRLTEARGGIFTPEEANSLYEACLLDAIDVCLSIPNVDVWICYNHNGNRTDLDSLLAQVSNPEKIRGVFSDQGGSFDDCIQYSADFILKSGAPDRLADGMLIIGGDLPTLQPYVLKDALTKLESLSNTTAGSDAATKFAQNEPFIGAAIVEGACQEGGFSIIGFTYTTPFDFHEVFYNLNGITALDMLVDKAEASKIPYGVVEMVPDLDIPVDLASAMPVLRSLSLAAQSDASILVPKRTIAFLQEMGLQSMALPPER